MNFEQERTLSHADDCDMLEGRIVQLQREIAWLRSEPMNLEGWFVDGDGEVFGYAAHPASQSITCQEWSGIACRDLIKMARHLASFPPEDFLP